MKNTFIFLVTIHIVLMSCGKDDSKPECILPDLIPNANGLEEIACTVNGEYWEAFAPFYLWGGLRSGYDRERQWFGFSGDLRIYGESLGHECFNDNDTIFQRIGIGCYIDNLTKNKIYVSGKNFKDFEGECSQAGKDSGYVIDTSQPYYIEFVHFDTAKTGSEWVTGTFEFDAINSLCSDTVRIRDGRFEVSK